MDNSQNELPLQFNQSGVQLNQTNNVQYATYNRKFIFQPPDSLEKQITDFKAFIINRHWNGQIKILNYFGTFKLEYWTTLEESLRQYSGFIEFIFQNTKLERKHLIILKSLIQWVKPKEISLKFKRNEMDDQDLEKFMIKWLIPSLGSIIITVIVVSNPGIFKGSFLSSLKNQFKKISDENPQFELHLIKNKEFKSMGIMRIQKPLSPAILAQKIALENTLKRTCYYQLSLRACFRDNQSEKNQTALENLIEIAYNEDKLEFIESLDVGNCNLGSEINFVKMCKKISTSKGLLSLGISDQKNITNSQLLQPLMGDRYDQFRILHIDIGGNRAMSELSVKIMADKLISRSLKTIDFGDTMTFGSNLELKIKYITDAFFKQIQYYEEIKMKEKIIQKFTIKTLDLFAIDGHIQQEYAKDGAEIITGAFTRPDLSEALLLSMVLNEFSSVKKLIMQSLDVGRINAQLKALSIFEQDIKLMKLTNSINAEFEPSLNSIEMRENGYQIEIDQFVSLLERFYFTKKIDLLQIKSVYFNRCFFKQERRLAGFTKFLQNLGLQKMEGLKVQYSLENFTIDLNRASGEVIGLLFQNVVFSKMFGLKSLTLQMAEVQDNLWEKFTTSGEIFLKSIPTGQVWSLQKLTFQDLWNGNGYLDVLKLVELLVFSDQVKLEELILQRLSVKVDQQSLKSLRDKAEEWDKPITIQKLYLEDFTYMDVLIEVLIIHPMSFVNELLISQPDKGFDEIQEYIIKYQKQGHKPMVNLKSLILHHFHYSEDEWELLADTFIFGRDINISSLEIIGTTISDTMSRGLNKSHESKRNYLWEINKDDLFCNSLTKLVFLRCTFVNEIFSLLFIAQKNDIKILHIRECFDFDQGLKKFQKAIQSNREKFSHVQFSLNELNMDQTKVENFESFEWFFRKIIFNRKNQQLHYLSMSCCALKNSHFECIIGIYQTLKKYYQINRMKGYLKLRKFNFNDQGQNDDSISHQNWLAFFDYLLSGSNCSLTYDEKNIENDDDQEQEIKDQIIQKNSKILEVVGMLQKKRLSIPERLLTSQNRLNTYNITPPVQLYKLELDVNFVSEEDQVKQQIYNLILNGLVCYTGSQLKELSLSRVDIRMFVFSSELSFQTFNKLNSIPLLLLKLSELKLSEIKRLDQILIRKLSQLYIQNLSINLEGLVIENNSHSQLQFHQNISECIEKGLQLGKVFALRILKLNCDNKLNIKETVQFFKMVVFNRNVPVSTLLFGVGLHLNFQGNFLKLINDHIILQQYKCPLKEVQISVKYQNSMLGGEQILPLLIKGDFIRLDKFNFQYTGSESLNFFENICDHQKLTNFSITDLTFGSLDIMKIEDFKFFYYVRPKLRILRLESQSTSFQNINDIKDFLIMQRDSQNQMQIMKPCELQLSLACGQIMNRFIYVNTELIQQFVFGGCFKWSEVSILFQSNSEIIKHSIIDNCFLNCADLKIQLRYLKIDLCLSFDLIPLSERSLILLGEQLIYDESSILEELCLISCDIKTPSIKALTQAAQFFRERIENGKLQKTTKLCLKRFCLHNSLSIMDGGADLINKDIFFYEYITIESIEVQGTRWNSNMMISQCNYAKAWLKFQSYHSRESEHFSIKLADWGFNGLVLSLEAWVQLCDTFLFSNNTPLLEVINMQHMDLQDIQIDWICQKAGNFFRGKPVDYIHPLKRLNFSGNNTLKADSWRKVSEIFFFAKHVKLEELNLISTILDSQEKLDAVFVAGSCAAFNEQNNKLSLHTLLTNDRQLKQYFKEIKSERPDDYTALKDQPTYLLNNLQGWVQDTPLSLGQTISILTKNIYQAKEISNFKWIRKDSLIFSEFHLDIASGLLYDLNLLFEKYSKFDGQIPLDLSTCDILCTLFKYSDKKGDPYPYKLLFTPEACQFYMTPSCKIRVINFIQTDTKHAEQMNQLQVFQFWQLVKSTKSSLNIVYVDYRLDDDLVDMMLLNGFNERDIINLVRLFPPQSIRLQDTLTLQALKAVYSIMFDNYQFNYSNILFDKDIFLNVGIGYSLREFVYRRNPTGFIGSGLKTIFYQFFNIFVTPVSKYYFSKEIQELNIYLSTQRAFFFILTLTTIIFYIVCLFGPYGWQNSHQSEQNDEYICFHGITPEGIYTYFGFAFFSCSVEAYLYWIVSQKIPKHIKGLFDREEVFTKRRQKAKDIKNFQLSKIPTEKDEEQQLYLMHSPKQINVELIKPIHDIDQIKEAIPVILAQLNTNVKTFALSKDGIIINCLMNLALSQQAKFSLYTDVTFIFLTYYCGYYYIASFALISTGFNVCFQLYNLIVVMYQFLLGHNNVKLLSTNFINEFFELSTIGRNVALSTILDTVAPYNVTVISNNFITKALVPRIAGKSMSNSVRAYLFKCAFGDVPHFILQLYFIITVALYYPIQDPRNRTKDPPKGQLSLTLYITIINTAISVMVSFIKFMSIRPSTLSQGDFDALAKEKNQNFFYKQNELIETEYEILNALTEFDIQGVQESQQIKF